MKTRTRPKLGTLEDQTKLTPKTETTPRRVRTPRLSNQSRRLIGFPIAWERSLNNQKHVASRPTEKRINPTTPVSTSTSIHWLCTVDTPSSPRVYSKMYLPPALAP